MKGNITKMKDFSSQVLPAVTIDFLFHDLYRRSFPQRLDPELLRRYNFYNPIPEGFVRCSFIAIGFLHCSSRRLHFFSFSVILDACWITKETSLVIWNSSSLSPIICLSFVGLGSKIWNTNPSRVDPRNTPFLWFIFDSVPIDRDEDKRHGWGLNQKTWELSFHSIIEAVVLFSVLDSRTASTR